MSSEVQRVAGAPELRTNLLHLSDIHSLDACHVVVCGSGPMAVDLAPAKQLDEQSADKLLPVALQPIEVQKW
jgi:hypothetical protein